MPENCGAKDLLKSGTDVALRIGETDREDWASVLCVGEAGVAGLACLFGEGDATRDGAADERCARPSELVGDARLRCVGDADGRFVGQAVATRPLPLTRLARRCGAGGTMEGAIIRLGLVDGLGIVIIIVLKHAGMYGRPKYSSGHDPTGHTHTQRLARSY